MGVPKFYRWISERYPCLSEVVKEFQIPEFDNLYLDMNGIVHVCSHPEDDNPHFRITEEKIFADIMYYIEFLFRMIKPRKVFFMAVDGVAPRAKMNQQRGRRFRSAREAEELEKRAMQKGETLPTEKRFDSNCITPGTPFMVRLQEQLKYMVVKKTSTDPLWQGVRVYLSGHETPGEGEHKIMDFIRAEKASPDYDANTRHCLYGLDADLMMLGLASHEPHFSLLREEVRFGGKKDSRNKRPQTPEETTFHLLHLSLFREYLDFEFSDLKEKLTTFEYNLENVIDDWVLMGFLVGNDFIPHLPNLHINHDALPLLWRTYMEVLPSCGGYINNGGHLNLERFEMYLTALSKFDFDTFSEQAGDLKWLESKKAEASAEKSEVLSAARKLSKNQKKTFARLNKHKENQFALLESIDDDMVSSEELGTELIDSPLEETSEEISEDISEESDDDTLGDEFRHHKRNYYMTKMEYEKVTPEVLQDQAEGYVRGIQWILLYYYEGVPSWSWFYQHHYAPYMSDVKDFKNMVLHFDIGTPFKPFEQLMAVLPAASKDLLPIPYQNLMINDTSPVIDFYPLQFDTDLNGKQQDWEAVVLIPFIDENRLLSAIRSVEHLLKDEERARNTHGPHLLFEYTPEPGDVYPSPLPDHFPDIAISHSKLTQVHMDEFRIPGYLLKKGILPGAKLDVFFPGFPTLKHIRHHAVLSKEGVKVFQMNSRGYNTMLYIEQEEEEPDIDKVAKEYLGKEIYVGWPHLYEAKVVAVCNNEYSYTQVEPASGKSKGTHQRPQVNREEIDDNTYTIFSKEISTIAERYKDRLGIVIGETQILLRALPMTGRKYIFSSQGRVTMDKQFGKLPVSFAKQATVKDIAVHDPEFCQFKTLKEYLPEGNPVFMLGWPHYACQGEVIETDMESGRIRINLSILEEPHLSNIINQQQMHADRYYTGYVIAQKIGISSHLFSRLTGTIYVTAGEEEVAREQMHPHKVNVGLNLKFTKRGEEVPGYTKNTEGQWTYSEKTLDVLKQYMAKFPEMFEIISKSNKQHNDMFYESDVIPKTCDYTLKTVEEYIKTLPCAGLKPMKSGADIISEGTIKALQELTDQIVETNKKRQKRVKMQVKPHLLYKPSPTSGSLIPDQSSTYQLFDRVVNTRQGFPVPFGLRGTVVGIHPAEVEVNTMYEVIFDEDFQGGIDIRNSSKRGYRMPPSGLLNLSHGDRKNGAKPANQTQTAARNQTFQGHQHRNVTNDFSYANASATRQPGPNQFNQGYQGQQGYHRNQAGYQSYPDNRTGYQDNQYSRGGNQQWERQSVNAYQGGYQKQNSQYERQNSRNTQDTKEDVYGKVFNGASAGTSQPTFVTPKVTQGNQSKRKLSTGESQQNKPAKPETNTNSEFDNIWKQLRSSQPPLAEGSSQGPSLSTAAAVLPRVPSPGTDSNKGSNSNQNATKIDVQSLFSGASSAKDTQTKQSGTTNVKTDNKPQSNKSKVVSNDEFAAMFKSLEEVQISKEENEKETEDGSDVLKKMLNIADQSETSENTEPPADGGGGGGGKSYGRQVSVQELFDGAKKQQEQPDADKPQEPQKKGKGYQKQKGQGHQSPRQPQGHQGQQQGYQGNAQNKRPALLMPQSRGGNRNPVMELMSFCQSLQMGLPMYDYIPKNGLHYCVVSLFNGARFQGSMCKSKEEAAESAASVALLQLRGSMQQMAAHPMMQMPGYVPGAMPQGRQFSSPNSAFSPVNTFTGFYQGNRGHGPRGYQGYQQQQQRPYSGGQGNTQHNRGGHQKLQNNSQFNSTNQQQGRNQTTISQNPQDLVTSQNAETRNDDRSLVNTSSNQKQSKEVKTQPTCVVTPFVPMQVLTVYMLKCLCFAICSIAGTNIFYAEVFTLEDSYCTP
ncbi:5'-3' exoribonuclease 1-like isoform X2 [Mercenaria mercenaria]|uniref:5'-3' exoribonuclease 1-like isoform X2 n=1 Tax=Mercenaria mercenaria TaxID=6596 RepID=UPI00234EA2AE|nr:5'-3' exoribonuclease 1-like isoform X2 [Mercenaria mercenaria]